MVAAAAATALCAPLHEALALTLGRATVQSALGETLRAEIELPDITEEEARTLQASIAAPQAFRAAGLEYNPALGSVRIERQRRADGRMVLQLSNDQPVQDPFVDLILQASWASGRVVRDYTLLLDPPQQRQAQAVAPTAPQLPPAAVPAPPPIASSPPPAPPAPAPAAAAPPPPPPPPAPTPVRPPAAAPTPPAAATPAPPPARAAASAPATPDAVTVRRGDTAGRLAAAHRPASVSLDQMLVAMLRSNPGAFIDGNVNRLRAGAVLDLPSAQEAAAVPAAEATRTIAAQSRDFNAYRSQMAGQVPAVPGGAQRSASGRVQAQVDDNRPAAAAPDRLTLSKGGVQSRAQEEQIARDKASKQAADRVAELSRNIDALNKLGATGATAPGAASPSASAPAPAPAPAVAPPPAPAPAPTPAPSAAPSASASPAPAPAEQASPPAPAAPPAPMPLPAAQEEGGGLLDALRSNPMWLAAGAALIALLAALGINRARQRRKAEEEEGRLQEPVESFFASSGGQHVDTGADSDEAASAVYSPSQIDTSSEVDPVAEAEVYLAYGRDLQAEEILKEALRSTPERVAIHAKLAEIYAKRRDAAALQVVAEQAHGLTGGTGPEWEAIAAQGRELLPDHPLWRDSPGPGLGVATATAAATAAAAHAAADPGESLWPDSVLTPPPADELDPQDLADLPPPVQPPAPALQPLPDISLDLGDEPEPEQPAAPAAAPKAAAEPPAPPMAEGMDFDFDVQSTYSAPLQAPAPAPAADSDLIPFDLGSLSLDIGEPGAEAPAAEAPAEPEADDPLATKLALAEEFQAIGDSEGARALAEEVLAEATGPLKAQAQRFLADLG